MREMERERKMRSKMRAYVVQHQYRAKHGAFVGLKWKVIGMDFGLSAEIGTHCLR